MAGFIDLTPQRLPFFGGESSLSRAFGLTTDCAVSVLALLSARVGLGRLLLRRVVAWVDIRVALLRQPICIASEY